MLITKKMLLAIGLIAALVGGGLGALITNSSQRTEAANDSYQNTKAATTNAAERRDLGNPEQFNTSAELVAYREGLEEGYNSCASAAVLGAGTSRNNVVSRNYTSRNYTTTRARRVSNNTGSRNVYYDYEQPRPKGRSFWSKHRDKLTMAIGTGTGAAIGGAAGGKKGAGIGALVGLGGSALYTYKIRKRSPRY